MADDGNNGPFLLAVIVFLAAFFLYFLPTLIAVTFRRRQTGAIFVLNLLLGWTGVGWAAAAVWAFVKDGES